MDKLSIVIVNFNAGQHLIGCLDSIKEVESEANIKVWVVDNASSDGSIGAAEKKFPKYNFIKNKQNLGFGKANNLAIGQIKDGFILLLNPDTILQKGVIETLLEFMNKNKEVGAATCKIVFENGEVDLTAHRGFPTPWASLLYFLGNDSLYHLTNRDLNSAHEVDAITGAFFLTTKKVLDGVGTFDEDYFMYAEDLDLCFRIKKMGYKVMYLPTVKVIHYKGISSGLKKHSQHQTSANLETRIRSVNYFYSTMKIFYRKNLENNYPFFINWLVYLGIDVRWILAKRKLRV